MMDFINCSQLCLSLSAHTSLESPWNPMRRFSVTLTLIMTTYWMQQSHCVWQRDTTLSPSSCRVRGDISWFSAALSVTLLQQSESDEHEKREERQKGKRAAYRMTTRQRTNKKTPQLSVSHQRTQCGCGCFVCHRLRTKCHVSVCESGWDCVCSWVFLQPTGSEQPNIATPPPAGSAAVRWAAE